MSDFSSTISLAVGTWIAVTGGSWSPTQEQMTEVRTKLEPHVTQVAVQRHLGLQQWSRYSFQYQGLTENGQKVIFINAFCTPPPSNAQAQLIMVFDGGTCFFQAKYRPETKEFLEVAFNGDA